MAREGIRRGRTGNQESAWGSLPVLETSMRPWSMRPVQEATAGFEPANEGFADPCLTAWRRRLGSFSERARGFEPPIFSLARRRSAAEPRPQGDTDQAQCRDPESNWGHRDFQSRALPTELSRRGFASGLFLLGAVIVPIPGVDCQAKRGPVAPVARVGPRAGDGGLSDREGL